MRLKKPILVQIKWFDAYADHPKWTSFDEYDGVHDMEITTVGYLFYEDKRYVVVAQNISNNESFVHTMTIPKSWIMSRKRL